MTAVHAQELIGYVEDTVNPEDLALIPGTKWVVSSTDKTPGKPKPGYLYIIDSLTGTAKLVDAKVARASTAGDPSCKPIPLDQLALSGLNMRVGADGSRQLLAVNRGDRMSVEFFDIDLPGSVPTLTWVGCLNMPAKAFPNSVVPMTNGGLAVTVSFETDNTKLVEQLEEGQNTGYLLVWTRESGFSRVQGSDSPLTNGVEVDQDERFFYVAGWGSESLSKLPVQPGEGSPSTVSLGIKPDNIRWSKNGNLIIAGQVQSATQIFECVASSTDVCPVPFKVIEVDPLTMTVVKVLIDGESLSTYAGATTALEVGGEIWVGSFRNKHIARYATD